MKIVLPKEIRGYHFPRIFTVEMNDFDIERLLPSLFYLVITSGRGRGGRKNKPTEFQAYLDRLTQHPRITGFDDSSSRRMLSRWIRAAVVQMGRLGRGGGKGEQIEYALPNTTHIHDGISRNCRQRKPLFTILLCGLPLETRRGRNRLNNCFGMRWQWRSSPCAEFKGVYDAVSD